MVKKLFALASVTALTGLVSAVGVAGCSDSTEPGGTPGDSGVADAKKDSKPPVETDGGDEPEPESCVAKDAIDHSQFGYKPANHQPGACSAQEAKDLNAWFAANSSEETLKMSDWAAEVSEKCAACVFSEESAANWVAILVGADDSLAGVNRGGCIEVETGKAACGEAYQQVSECILAACLPTGQGGFSTCKSQDEFDSCRGDLQSIFVDPGPCKDAYAAMQTACGNDLGDAEEACQGTKYTFEGPIQKLCVQGGGDAGDGG